LTYWKDVIGGIYCKFQYASWDRISLISSIIIGPLRKGELGVGGVG